jgi:hypothetical protein
MGLRVTHNCFEGAYSGFSKFRKDLGKAIGINLNEYKGFGGELDFSIVYHGIVPLLNHSDCDGVLTVNEAVLIVGGLTDILSKQVLNKESQENALKFATGLLSAIAKNEVVEFR